MKNKPEEFPITSARDALSFLSSAIYEKYGKDVLPLIEDAWHGLGVSIGKTMKKQIADKSPVAFAEAFVDAARRRGTPIDIIELNDRIFHMKSYKCALGMKGKGKSLCWAVMGSDRGIFEEASGRPLRMEILKTLAENDQYCEIVIEWKG